VLSELYMGNGANRLSWVEDDRQLVWEGRFAPPDPDYFRVHTLDLGGKPATPPVTKPEDLHARFEEAFARTPPLTGAPGMPPTWTLYDWPARASGAPPMSSRSVPLADRGATEAMARRLKGAWVAANGDEKAPGPRRGGQPSFTPEEEAEIRALGYAAAKRHAATPRPSPSPPAADKVPN
jgi:hypothetical protein